MALKHAVLPAAAATLLATTRWALQGSWNVYTDMSRGAYVPDEALGFRWVEDGPVWLGLDAIGILAGLTAFVAFAAWVKSRRSVTTGAFFTYKLWIVSAATLAVPVVAFASGTLPEGARERLETQRVQAPAEGVRDSLEGLPAGRYIVSTDHEATELVATVSAAGESFETRFGDVGGSFRGDPGDLGQALQAEISASAASVDTGVELRSKHATEYLQAQAHPRMTLAITSLEGTERSEDGTVTFGSTGTLSFIGDELPVQLTGTFEALDEDARQRLGIAAEHAMIIRAGFALTIADTKLAEHAGDFSAETIPIRTVLVLTRQ